MVGSIVRLLRVASFAICAIVILSFAIFALERTSGASNHQRAELAGGAPAAGGGSHAAGGSHEGTVHRAIDRASAALTSPFAGLLEGSSSEWATRGVRVLLALLVYGFGLGFLARALRLRI